MLHKPGQQLIKITLKKMLPLGGYLKLVVCCSLSCDAYKAKQKVEAVK